MSRLSYPDQNQVPADVQEYLAQLPQDAVIRTLSYSPETVKAFVALGQKMYTSLTLPERVRELAILAVATTSRCEYVFAQHESFAERAGLNREERDAIRRGDHTYFFESDRAILDFASALAAGPEVDDRTFTAARTILGDRHIVEMLELCGYYLAFGRICTVLQLEIEVHGAGVLDQIKAMKDS